MFKTILTAAILTAALSAPAFAADMMKCDDATFKMMNDEMGKMKDAKKKDEAMKHMTMAMDSMKGKKMDECSKHLDEAHKAMK